MAGESPVSREEAKSLVEEIATKHGYLCDEIISQIPSVVRRKVMNALDYKDEMIGSSVFTLARNLYTSNARFVFELLQNADDNHYTQARAAGVAPFVRFQVHPHRIVVECNEDGFTPENLKAICSVGESTKTGTKGYIGEKGIGFKSVFMAAWKVHIRSANFSFYFQHRRGESGIGMISPVWEEPEEDLACPLTRITLFLHEDGDATTIQAARESIFQQFRELQDTILLFLENLKQIEIKFYDDEGSCTCSTSYSKKALQDSTNNLCLQKVGVTNGNKEDSKKYFHVTKSIATNLAKNENRDYSDAEENVMAYSTAEVLLAFPLTESSIPIIESQELFAFLPVRKVGFMFLIQTDFVTQANRQDIVTTSARNLGLIDGIADAFIEAVLKFCQHSTLQYQWMRYLPQDGDYPWDGFWKNLVSRIKTRLSSIPVLRPRSQGHLRLIQELRRNTMDSLDKNGQPLFDDIQPEIYLSNLYQVRDLDKLTSYGLQYMNMAEIIARVAADLKRSQSRMKSSSTDDDWHSRAAQLLCQPFQNGCHSSIRKLKELELLPSSEVWKMPPKHESLLPFYYPDVDGVAIPADLSLNLINNTAAKNPDRRKLFDYLGVTKASTNTIKSMIFQKHSCISLADRSFSVLKSLDHLKFLYLTHVGKYLDLYNYQEIAVYTQDGSLLKPYDVDVYISDGHPYGAHELLKKLSTGTEPGNGALGFAVPFLAAEYLRDIPNKPEGHYWTWLDWLHSCLGILRHVKLILANVSLTNICKYVAKHRPEKFLGTLQHHWQFEKHSIIGNINIVENLQNIKVLCQGNRKYNLCKTYLPLPKLEQCCARFMDEGESFPFLKLETSLHQTNLSEWMFLHDHFSVRLDDDVEMYLTILVEISVKNTKSNTFKRMGRVFDLYEVIHAKYLESKLDDRKSQLCKTRKSFRENGLVLLPSGEINGYPWAGLALCRWDAPPNMKTRRPLGSMYDIHFRGSETSRATLTQFFKHTLGVLDCTWNDFVDELKELKRINCTDFDRIKELYSRLDRLKAKAISAYEVNFKQAFEDNALIFVSEGSNHGWYKVSQCLWSSATQIRGKVTLNDQYTDMKGFFVDFLGIATLTLQMVYDELKEKGTSKRATVAQVKETLWAFNSFLSAERELPSPEPILKGRLFPVYDKGQVELQSAETTFAIVDRKPLEDAFRDKARLLDFTLDEVRRLKPFFQWADLEPRYLSTTVKEVSALEGGYQVPISSLERDIRRKAHALFRIAVHFESDRTQYNDHSLYHLLKSAEVLETDGISSELHLCQGGQTHKVQVCQSELHIQESQSGLKIYVPRDAASQDVCYFSKLPRRFVEWMMTNQTSQTQCKIDEAAVRAVSSILTARKAALARILESQGITDANFTDEEDLADEEAMGHIERPPTAQHLRPTTPSQASGQASVFTTPSFHSDGETFSNSTPASSVLSFASSQTNSSVDSEVSFLQLSTRLAANGVSRGRVGRSPSPRPQTRPIPQVLQSAPDLAADVDVRRKLHSAPR